ncbi:hypothetical protein GCM10027168_55100 [Streptomyces capparidis]
MTEGVYRERAPILVRAPTPDDPPFRLVEIKGEVVGKAFGIADLIEFARRAGLEHVDFDDPEMVTWVGGDQYRWVPRHR